MAHENKMPWIRGEGEDRCGLRRARRPVSGMTTAHSEPRTGGGAGAPHGGEDHVGSLSSLVASLGEGSHPSNARADNMKISYLIWLRHQAALSASSDGYNSLPRSSVQRRSSIKVRGSP